ncbi:MAG: hypothetical protein ACQEXJ_07480 [Myxococcota bacterium]
MVPASPQIEPHEGRPPALTPGMGAVATTCVAGFGAIRRGLPMALLEGPAFAGCDVYRGGACDGAVRAHVPAARVRVPLALERPHVEPAHVQGHDTFTRHPHLEDTLRVPGGEQPVTHPTEGALR